MQVSEGAASRLAEGYRAEILDGTEIMLVGGDSR